MRPRDGPHDLATDLRPHAPRNAQRVIDPSDHQSADRRRHRNQQHRLAERTVQPRIAPSRLLCPLCERGAQHPAKVVRQTPPPRELHLRNPLPQRLFIRPDANQPIPRPSLLGACSAPGRLASRRADFLTFRIILAEGQSAPLAVRCGIVWPPLGLAHAVQQRRGGKIQPGPLHLQKRRSHAPLRRPTGQNLGKATPRGRIRPP